MRPSEHLESWLQSRLSDSAREWLDQARHEIAAGVTIDRFCALLSVASRHARLRALELSAEDGPAAQGELPGWNPERWNLLESVRVALILARPDLEQASGAEALEEAYRYADEGETCALSRSLALLPNGAAMRWRAAECCRSNMVSVFEATVLDTPYLAEHFDVGAFNQAAIKALFIGAPLWRLYGLDERLSEELAQIALDLADERRSAHRTVQHELWLCLGTFGGARAVESLGLELTGDDEVGRQAAAYGLVRAGQTERLAELLTSLPSNDPAHAAARDALSGNTSQAAFRQFEPQAS